MLTASAFSAQAGLFGSDEREGATEACFKRQSRAWCAYDAANLSTNVRDMRRGDVVKALKGDSPTIGGETVVDIGMMGATLAGVFSSGPGFTNAGDAAMIALNMLVRTNIPTIAKANFVFGWMPYEMAANAEEAASKAVEMTGAAARAVFKDYVLEPVTLAVPRDASAYSLDRLEYLAHVVRGGDCDKAECILVQDRIRMPDYYATIGRAVEQKAPEWLGGYKAWFFHGQLVRELRVNGDFVSQLYAAKLSAELPKWSFVSVTPQSNLQGALPRLNRGQRLSLLFNQGKPMATVFPELEFRDDPAAAELKLVKSADGGAHGSQQ